MAGNVIVSYIHPNSVSAWFHHSVTDLHVYDAQHRRRIGGRLFEFSGANLSSARNSLVRRFLDDTRGEWLWMVDADMVFPPTVLDDLLVNADPKRAPIVGGLCFGINDGRLFPTLYSFERDEENTIHALRYEEFPEDAMFQVGATGAACLLIHRGVLEAVRDRCYNAAFPWFQETQLGDKPCSEDITFCLRAGMLGIPIHVDTGVHIGHHKDHLLTAEMFHAQREADLACRS